MMDDIGQLVALAKTVDQQLQSPECGRISKSKKKKKKSSTDTTDCPDNHKKRPRVDEDTQKVIQESLEIEYPYQVNPDDHCETKADGYEIIADILDYIATKYSKTRETLSIYDPYYCEGSMIKEMNSLGFLNVYNRKEDFYEKQRTGSVPDYDVLITNPPYSDEHMERIVRFSLGQNKPFFLLLPNYVYMKVMYPTAFGQEYYLRLLQEHTHKGGHPFYVVPTKRLLYTTPKGRRQAKSAKFTSPFPTFWYCHVMSAVTPPDTTQLLQALRAKDKRPAAAESCSGKQANSRVICLRPAEFPPEVLTEADPRKKKERNALKRKKNKARKQDKGGGTAR